MKTISKIQLKNLLAKIRSPQSVSVTTLTDANTIGCPFKIKKFNQISAEIDNYQSAVNAQRKKEGKRASFRAFPPLYGKRISLGLLKRDNRYYLPLQVFKDFPVYIRSDERGKVVPVLDRIVKKYIKEPNSSRQGLKYPVKLRNFNIDNIIGINIGGNEYSIKK